MKTLRSLVKSGNIEEKGRRSRKVSLPAQRYQPEDTENERQQKHVSLWQNVKRKISFSISSDGQERMEGVIETRTRNGTAPNDSSQTDSVEVDESPRLRRVNSDVGEEDVMHFAIIESDFQLLQSILTGTRVNVNYLRPPGVAPLHQACIVGNREIVELLVKNGANINLRDHRDLTPLQLANCHGHFDIAEYLLRMGSPVTDIKDGFQIEKRRRKRSWCFKLGSKQTSPGLARTDSDRS